MVYKHTLCPILVATLRYMVIRAAEDAYVNWLNPGLTIEHHIGAQGPILGVIFLYMIL